MPLPQKALSENFQVIRLKTQKNSKCPCLGRVQSGQSFDRLHRKRAIQTLVDLIIRKQKSEIYTLQQGIIEEYLDH